MRKKTCLECRYRECYIFQEVEEIIIRFEFMYAELEEVRKNIYEAFGGGCRDFYVFDEEKK